MKISQEAQSILKSESVKINERLFANQVEIDRLQKIVDEDLESLAAIYKLLGDTESPVVVDGNKKQEPAEKITFRDLIKQSVEEKRGDKLTIGQVVAAITAKGYKEAEGAKTPLKTKVGNELYKLATDGTIGKDGKGSYWAL